jgi:hypothetical protein
MFGIPGTVAALDIVDIAVISSDDIAGQPQISESGESDDRQ